MQNKNQNQIGKIYTIQEGLPQGYLSLSEFRRELGISLVLAKKLVVLGEIKAVKALDGTIQIAVSEISVAKKLLTTPWKRAYFFVRALGPGLITGASDDDPSGIATYSSVGAKFGFSILWMATWLLPMMLAVQETCARIGIVTNKGLSNVLKKHYHRWVVLWSVILLIIANTINLGADLGAMAAALKLVVNVNFYVAAIGFALLVMLLEVFVQYHTYVKFLKWLTISVFSYIIAGIIIKPDWITVLKEAFVPEIHLNSDYLFAMIAVFGTTITPYLFFWQASEEVEDGKMENCGKSCRVKKDRIVKMRTDVNTGMLLANIVFFFIVITTAQVLFRNGITNIESAEQAALALRPLAGDYAYFLFAFGIIGTGLLAVPILAGSGAYALAELFEWNNGLEERFSKARGFYLIIIASIIVGLGLNFIGINPIVALYWSAFINGIIALPLLVVIMLAGDNKKIMGKETNPLWVRIFGWASIVFMFFSALITIILHFGK